MFNDKFTIEDIILYFLCFTLISLSGAYFYMVQVDNNREKYLLEQKALLMDLKLSDDSAQTNTNFLKAQLQLVHRRYDFNNKVLIASTSMRYVTFLVGAFLAILGVSIVIRRVRDSASDFEANAQQLLQLKFKGSSPGIIIVLAGTIIIVVAILKGFEANTNDLGITIPAMPNQVNAPDIQDPITPADSSANN